MSYAKPFYKHIASTLQARLNCIKSGNQEWLDNHEDTLDQFDKLLPSGSGIDSGCKIDLEKSAGEKIVINFSFHHMDESGMYCGWSDHTLIVTPSLTSDIDLRITGRDKGQIKEYLYEMFTHALEDVVDYETCDQSKGEKRAGYYFSISTREVARKYQEGIANGSIV